MLLYAHHFSTRLWLPGSLLPSPLPLPAHLPRSGPGGPPCVYLTSSFIDTSRPVPTPVSYIEALDPATGQRKWANFTAPPPPSGLPSADTAALHGVTAVPGLAVYAQGSRLYGLSAETGKQVWGMVVSAGSATGLAANVTSVTLVEAAPGHTNGRPFPLLLLTSSSWDQTRFMGYALNGTNITSPPTVAWQVRAGVLWWSPSANSAVLQPADTATGLMQLLPTL